jgi:hypothetical protein
MWYLPRLGGQGSAAPASQRSCPRSPRALAEGRPMSGPSLQRPCSHRRTAAMMRPWRYFAGAAPGTTTQDVPAVGPGLFSKPETLRGLRKLSPWSSVPLVLSITALSLSLNKAGQVRRAARCVGRCVLRAVRFDANSTRCGEPTRAGFCSPSDGGRPTRATPGVAAWLPN